MNLRTATRPEVLPLFERFHAYQGVSNSLTYCFAVEEKGKIVAAFAWQPPPPGSAKSVCPEASHAVLSLSRMVAVPKAERDLRHISKPLRRQMRALIDRTRWPVLVTYSDEGLGHTGHVYKCSGWTPTVRAERPQYQDASGVRTSTYSNGKHSRDGLTCIGKAVIQRWEHWACPPHEVAGWLERHGWRHEAVPGKVWRSGNPAHRWVRD